MNANEFLIHHGLDFNVSKVPLHTYDVLYPDDYNETRFFATVNDDTGKALGMVKSRYTVLQNNVLLDSILNKLRPDSYNLDESSCGTFNGGRKIYFFIKLNKEIEMNIGNNIDDMSIYLYALSSHDGSQRLVYGVTTKMHSCANMFATLMADKDNNFVVKHTKHINDVNDKMINSLIDRNIAGIKNLFTIMAEHQPNEKFIGSIKDIVAKTDGKKKIIQSVKDKRDDLSKSIEHEMMSKGQTFYGLFNGLTHYLTHKHNDYTNWSDKYELLTGNTNSYTKTAMQLIVKELRSLNAFG